MIAEQPEVVPRRRPQSLPHRPDVQHSPRLHRGPRRPARGMTQHSQKIRTPVLRAGRTLPAELMPAGFSGRLCVPQGKRVPPGHTGGSDSPSQRANAPAYWAAPVCALQTVQKLLGNWGSNSRTWGASPGVRHAGKDSRTGQAAGSARGGHCAGLSGRPWLGCPTDPRGAESGQRAGGLLGGPKWEPSGRSARQDPGAGRQSPPLL